MTREDDPGKSPPETKEGADRGVPADVGRDERDEQDDAMSALLKRSLGARDAEPPAAKEFLRGVQKRIRTRSRGKFYADGWSTSSSRVSYMVVAVAMLLVIAIAYFALGPMGVSAR
jgi:hypothetical protein